MILWKRKKNFLLIFVAPLLMTMACSSKALVSESHLPVSSPGGLPFGYQKVWAEEFSQEGLPSPLSWRYDSSRNKEGWYNSELQYYSSYREKNTLVTNGVLKLTAHKEDLSQMPDWGGQKYSSARIDTKGKLQWRKGFYEIRAKLPCGLGTWPALWMLGSGGQWPFDGEIDIMEHVGKEPGLIFGSIHNTSFYGATARTGKIMKPRVCEDFHRFQLQWDDHRIAFGVDDTVYYEYSNPRLGYDTWPFDQDFYLILNVAIGGHLGGPVDDSIFPVTMEVDYIRVYQAIPSLRSNSSISD